MMLKVQGLVIRIVDASSHGGSLRWVYAVIVAQYWSLVKKMLRWPTKVFTWGAFDPNIIYINYHVLIRSYRHFVPE